MFFFVDWQLLIAAVRFWMTGGNPYGPFPLLNGELTFSGAFAYPPPALLIGVPMAVLPVWLSGLIVTLLAVVGFEYWACTSGEKRSALYWLLLWLPLTQQLWIGQLTLIALVSLVLAEQAYQRRHDRLAGILLALSILKPQTVLLAVAWLLFVALRERRWSLLVSFVGLSVVLWLGPVIISGPQIYTQWLVGLNHYSQLLPNRPLLFPPFGPLLGVMAVLLWHRSGRGDIFGLALLVNTLVYPLSVIYVASAVALVVIRWNPRWSVYPLVLSWAIPMLLSSTMTRTPDTIAGLTQSIIATGLLAGLLPQLRPRVLQWKS